MKRFLLLLAACTFAFAAPIAGHAQVIESYGDNGAVDWSNMVVRAKGIAVQGGVGGRAGQIRAAELDALRQILETVKGMRLSSETLVENYMLSSDVIRTRIQGVVRNFRRVGDPEYMSDGSIEVTVEMKLTGENHLIDAVMPPTTGGAQRQHTGAPEAWGAYTGLVVDARGLGVRPAIAPQIYSESGNVIYGQRYVDRQWVIQQGMAEYAKSLESARDNDRVGETPMVVKAQDARGENRTDVVISDEDARKLHAVSENYTFLQQARVVIVVD